MLRNTLFVGYLLFISGTLHAQNVGINTTGATPNASAILDLNTGNNYSSPNGQGILVPNVALISANDAVTIATPPTSLLVYVPSGSGLTPAGYYYNAGTPGAPNWVLINTTATAGSWLITGNAGTSPGTNYIGTTDAEALEFKANGQRSGWIDYTTPYNTSFGYEAALTNTGVYNSAFGYQALNLNTTGAFNTAIGAGALLASNGNNATAVGYEALYFNTGNNNTAVGYGTLLSNTSGSSNTGNGYEALYNNTSGIENTAYGQQALYSNTTGNNNTAIGYQALFSNTTTTNNTATGIGALFSNTAGSNNVADGVQALYNNTSGSDKTANGQQALFHNISGGDNTATGYEALYFNISGTQNTATGLGALNGNTIGSSNTGNGYEALYNNTTGGNNTALGLSALLDNTTGALNTAVGSGALELGNGNNATAVGYDALYNNSGSNNTAVGYFALLNTTTGIDNTAMGLKAAFTCTGAADDISAFGAFALQNSVAGVNTAVGFQAGLTNTAGNGNTFIGVQADENAGTYLNVTALGYQAVVTASNNMMFGNTAVVGWGFGASPTPGLQALIVGTNATNGNGANLTLTGNWTSTSDSTKKRDIQNISYGLPEVMKLRPVSYLWKGTDKKDIGFLAQEVKHTLPEIVYGEEGHMTLSYGQITPVLVKAIQEQQHMIDSLKAENTKLQNEEKNLKTANDNLQNQNKVQESNLNHLQNTQEQDEADITALKKTVNSLMQLQASAK